VRSGIALRFESIASGTTSSAFMLLAVTAGETADAGFKRFIKSRPQNSRGAHLRATINAKGSKQIEQQRPTGWLS
jgi:hypothetical protein